MIKIEMLDDEGNVTEVCDAQDSYENGLAPRCDDADESPVFCLGPEGAPVLSWVTSNGMLYAVHRACLDRDAFVRVIESV